ncbi:MAG: hypothetical protein NTY03_01955 [Candidatus Bathyarchaeota archaeon]|nr:hypothetical protein [Candidatus Bathyarchaeota archaeon]
MVTKLRDKEEIDISIRLYQVGDEDKIVKLLLDVFKQWPVFDIGCSLLDHWKWKYIDNPANKDIFPHVVAEYKGEIIGVSHGMWYYTKVGDGIFFSSKGTDVAVNQKFRGMGLYTKLTKLKHNICYELGWQFNYNLTANPIISRASINTKPEERSFPFPHSIKNFLKIEDIGEFFKHSQKETKPWKRLYLKIGLIGSKAVNRLTNIQPRTPELKDVQFKEVSIFDESFDKFYDKVKSSYSFIVEKTVKYMNWRYCDKRGGDYKVRVAEKNDEIVGYLVLRVNSVDKDNPVGYIMDVLALNGRDDVVDYFIKLSVDYFKERHINVVRAQLVGGHAYERILSKYGFLGSREKPYLTYTPIMIGEDLDKFRKAQPTMFHYPYGESDSI